MAFHVNKNNNLKIGHINIRSIVAKINRIRDCIMSNRFDILAVSETWLTRDIDDVMVSIDGYELVRMDRVRGRGGGVLLYVRNSIEFNILSDLKSDTSEQIWIEYKINAIKSVLGVVYRPPGFKGINDFFDEFEHNMSKFLLQCENLICIGDFNINVLNLDCVYTRQFLALLHAYGLKQVIDEPTRRGLTNASLIDLIICSNSDVVLNSYVDTCFDISDHFLVRCELRLRVTKFERFLVAYRDFKNFDEGKFYSDLLEIPFDNILYIQNINEKLCTFNAYILNLFNVHAPLRSARITKKKAPWLNQGLRHAMRLRNKALTKYKKNKSLENWESYRRLRNYVTLATENEKKLYLESNFRSNNPKNNWKLLRDLDISSKVSSCVPEHLGNVEDINTFFVTAAGSSAPDPETLNFYLQNKKQATSTFHFRVATTGEIEQALFSIGSRAVGTDGIGITMLLNCCPRIIPFIVHLVNSCIETNCFPDIWKSSFIIPFPKVTSPKDLKDLRPISILPTLSKVIERVMERQMREHIERYGLLPDFQSGFRKDHSCATALLKVTDDILSAADRGELTALVLLDYSKAFDRINHTLLLAILGFLDFGGDACGLIKSYLENRTQCVKLNRKQSSQVVAKCGVPQGSILGPLLFTLYTSQLTVNLKNVSTHLYADDTQIYMSFRPEQILEANDKLSNELEHLRKVSLNHCLELNPKKSQLLLFGREQCRDQYQDLIHVSINNDTVQVSNVARNLGLLLDVKLRFSEHISGCIRKAFANLKLIFNQRHLLNAALKKSLCESLVLSHFAFCDTVYGPCLVERDVRRIQRMQNCCVRLIGGIRKYERGLSAGMKEIGWLIMSERRHLHSLVLFNKIIFKKIPNYLYQKIKFRYDAHALDLRHKFTITPPYHRTALFERSFSYQISMSYNKLPADLRQLKPTAFKHRARNMLITLPSRA